jgi:hypothetical protein
VVLRALHLYLVLFQQLAAVAALLIPIHLLQVVLVVVEGEMLIAQVVPVLLGKVMLVVLDFKLEELALVVVEVAPELPASMLVRHYPLMVAQVSHHLSMEL